MSGTESLILRMQQAMQGLRDTTRQANTEADNLRRSFAAIDAAARDAIANGFTGRGTFRNYLPQGSDDLTNLQRQQARDHAVSLLNQQSPTGGGHNIGATIASAVRNETSQFFRTALATAGVASLSAFAFRGADRAVGLNLDSDKLMRLVGGLSGGFDDVLDGLDKMANQVTMAEDEMAKLAVTMAKLGGVVDTSTIPGLVKTSRAFGFEDDRIPKWMSTMKWHGANSSDLLPTLAATMARTGMGGRGEELLDAFEEYASRTEKVLLHTADLGGFAVSMSALGAMKDAGGNPLPGLRGAAGAALLKQIDDGFRQSGAGEAGEVARGRFWARQGVTNAYEQKFRAEDPISANPQMLEDYFKFTKQLIGGDDPYRWYDGIANDIGISRHAAKNIMDFQANDGDISAFGTWLNKTTGKGLADAKEEAFPDLTRIWDLSEAFNSGNYSTEKTGALFGLLKQYKIDPANYGGEDPSNYGNLIDAVAKAAMNGPEATKAEDDRRMMLTISNTQLEAGKMLLKAGEKLFDVAEWAAKKLGIGEKEETKEEAIERANAETAADASADYANSGYTPDGKKVVPEKPKASKFLGKETGTEPALYQGTVKPTVPGDKTTSWLGNIGRGVGDAVFGPSGVASWMSGSAVAGTLPGELTPEQRGESPAATVAKVSGSGSGAAKLSGSKADFVARIRPAAEAAAAKLGVPADALVAQAALETGWGKSVAGNNLFGIKAHGWSGKSVNTGTQESINGKMVSIKDNFRAYDSYEESFNDYANLIGTNPRYAKALQSGGDPQAYFQALKDGKYATDDNYVGKLMGTMKAVQGMEGGSTAASSGGSVKWQPGVHLGTKSTDGGAAASGGMVIGIGGGTEAPVKWEPGVHLGTKRIDDGGAPAAGGDVKWEPGVHLGTKRIDDYNMQLPEGTSAAASARDAPSAVRDMLSSMGGPGGELGRMVGDMRATIDVVQKSDMGEVLSQHSRQFALGGVPQPQHMLAGAKAMMGAAQGLANGFTGAMARR